MLSKHPWKQNWKSVFIKLLFPIDPMNFGFTPSCPATFYNEIAPMCTSVAEPLLEKMIAWRTWYQAPGNLSEGEHPCTRTQTTECCSCFPNSGLKFLLTTPVGGHKGTQVARRVRIMSIVPFVMISGSGISVHVKQWLAIVFVLPTTREKAFKQQKPLVTKASFAEWNESNVMCKQQFTYQDMPSLCFYRKSYMVEQFPSAPKRSIKVVC